MTMTTEELLAKSDIQKIADEGKRIYAEKKDQYEPASVGKFLAIEVNSGDVYLADSSAEAVSLARQAHPEQVFYVVRIGFESAEAMARAFSHRTT